MMFTTRLTTFHRAWPEALPIVLSLATFALFAIVAAIGRGHSPIASAQPIIIVWTAVPTASLPGQQFGRAPQANISLRPLAPPEPTAAPVPTDEPAPLVIAAPTPEPMTVMRAPATDNTSWYTDIATPEPA